MNTRARLVLESLEDRWCPALTTSLNSGVLTISGVADNGSISVVQDSTTAGTITVSDGTTAVTGSPFAGVTSVKLNLTSADDNVTIDLGGQALPGKVSANLGGGADTLTVQNGTITGALDIASSAASGGHCGGGRGRGPGARGAAQSPSDTGADIITLALGTTVGNLAVRTGLGGATVEVAGTVTGDIRVDAFVRTGTVAGTSLSVTGEVDGNVIFQGSSLADTLAISGDVGRSVVASTLGGADKVTLGGTITGRLNLDTGAGDDLITLSSTVGGRATLFAGLGNDTLNMTSSTSFLASAVVSMGAGNDSVTLDDAATITTLLVNGGTGTDVFTGTATRTGLRLVSF